MSGNHNERPGGEFVLYQTEDGQNRIQCQLVDGTIWLSQMQMGELFQRSKQTISEHLQNIFEEDELREDSVVRNFRTTAADGKDYDVTHYALEAIIAVGMRVVRVLNLRTGKHVDVQTTPKGYVADEPPSNAALTERGDVFCQGFAPQIPAVKSVFCPFHFWPLFPVDRSNLFQLCLQRRPPLRASR